MEQYDFVVITEAPKAKTAAVLLAIGMHGNTRTETLCAQTVGEFKELIAGLP